MDAIELAREVREMRRLQAEYFKGRDMAILDQSKKQERKVDRLVEEVLNPTLFGSEDE